MVKAILGHIFYCIVTHTGYLDTFYKTDRQTGRQLSRFTY